jgi:hypothetical protein
MRRLVYSVSFLAALLSLSSPARAQSLPPPVRSDAWQAVSVASMAVGLGTQLFMPRIYESDVETTIGWKARWHVSVLAPTMTIAALGMFNELFVKPAITSYLPGCAPSNAGVPGCTSFGMPSTYTFVAFSALGHGAAVITVDSLKWSGGQVNAGAVAGDVAVPLVASIFTLIGRVAGSPAYERGDQAVVGAGVGLVVGVVTGAAYALLQRPECGYGDGIVCW